MPPSLEGMHYRHHLLFMGCVPLFRILKLMTFESHQVPLLSKNPSNGFVLCICVDLEWFFKI